jgi:hypothetical protein
MAQNRWIEIVSVRLCDPSNRKAVQDIFAQLNSVLPLGDVRQSANQVDGIELYLDMKTETDWYIYLHWLQLAPGVTKTVLGVNIAEAFNVLGLVNHTMLKQYQGRSLTAKNSHTS